jgi:hypothetical protein
MEPDFHEYPLLISGHHVEEKPHYLRLIETRPDIFIKLQTSHDRPAPSA